MKKHITTDQSNNVPLNSIQASTQRDRMHILALLKQKPRHTIEFREQHGLISPAPRIKELRTKGYNIKTALIKAYSQDGRLHSKVALYTFISEPPATNRAINEV